MLFFYAHYLHLYALKMCYYALKFCDYARMMGSKYSLNYVVSDAFAVG